MQGSVSKPGKQSAKTITIITQDQNDMVILEPQRLKLSPGERLGFAWQHRGNRPKETTINVKFPQGNACSITSLRPLKGTPIKEINIPVNGMVVIMICADAGAGLFRFVIDGKVISGHSPDYIIGDDDGD